MKDLNKYERTRKVLVFLMDIFIYYISFIISFLIRYKMNIPAFNYRAFESASLYIMISFGLLNIFSGLYILYNKRKTDIFYSTIINQLLMIVIVTVLTFFGRWLAFPRTIIVLNFIISTLLLVIWRFIAYTIYQYVSGVEKIMVVGHELTAKRAVRNFEGGKNKIYKVTSVVYDNFYNNVAENLDDIDIIYLTEDVKDEEYRNILSLLTKKEKKIYLSSSFENLIILNSNNMNIEDETFLDIPDFSIPMEMDLIKRFVDFIVSIILLIITLPLIAMTAIIIKITSPGPILYKQTRITKNQKEFKILKFRTMSTTAEKNTGPVLASANDERVTPVGKYLRSLRVDELPQLINVLKGDMSLVGPRPERPFFVDQFNHENKHYYLRHTVRAGITGYAQVNGKYATDFKSKLNFDLLYIKKYSLILDIEILLQTIKTLFDKMSSQGLEEDYYLEDYSIKDEIKVYR